jgi:hypothetical protein
MAETFFLAGTKADMPRSNWDDSQKLHPDDADPLPQTPSVRKKKLLQRRPKANEQH